MFPVIVSDRKKSESFCLSTAYRHMVHFQGLKQDGAPIYSWGITASEGMLEHGNNGTKPMLEKVGFLLCQAVRSIQQTLLCTDLPLLLDCWSI